MKKVEVNDSFRRSTFIHGFIVCWKDIFITWHFSTAYVITGLTTCYLFFNKIEYKNSVDFIKSNAINFFSAGVGAISMILAALAIAVVIYNRNSLHDIALADTSTLESFLFPYVFGAVLWGIVCITSLLIAFNIIPLANVISLIVVVFFLNFATIYMINLVFEVIQHIINAAIKDDP